MSGDGPNSAALSASFYSVFPHSWKLGVEAELRRRHRSAATFLTGAASGGLESPGLFEATAQLVFDFAYRQTLFDELQNEQVFQISPPVFKSAQFLTLPGFLISRHDAEF